MAKRFTTIFFIVLGIIAFLGVGLFLVLILAPGTRIFGMMYVANNARAYNSGRLNVITELEKQGFSGFSGSVTIEASEIPIYIEYTERYVYEFEYVENYIGLTKTDIERPSFSLSKDKTGGLVVKVNGFEKFIFENKATVRYFKLYVPMVDVSGSGSGDTNLTIKSVKSDITFYKTLGDGETRTPNFNTVSIETKGKIVLNGSTKAKTYKLVSPNTIKIDKNFKNVVEATHYNLESTKGKIVIEPVISGDLNLKTKNGSIKLVSCRNLTVNTEHGDIVGLDADGKVDVAGMVYITSKSGKVSFGKVQGGAQSIITTSSGKVSIDKIGEALITTKRGSVNITSVEDAIINTNTGNVAIEESLESLKITTIRGKVTLGGEGMTMKNIDVFSHIGRVYVKSAHGSAVVKTNKSDVSFTNTTCTNITIDAGGKLVATGLTGTVNINVAKDADLTFTTITKDTTINGGAKTKNIVIWALQNSADDTAFSLSGKHCIHYEANDNGTGSYSTLDQGANISNRISGSGPALSVDGKGGNVKLYMKASNKNVA